MKLKPHARSEGDKPRYLTRGAAAWMLSISPRTLDKLVREGIIPVTALSTKLVRFDVRDLERVMAERKLGRGSE